MSRLIQKPITDKNGITSKRWVREEAVKSAKTLAVPMPSSVRSADTVYAGRILRKCSNLEGSIGIEPELIWSRLLKLPSHTLDYLNDEPEHYLATDYLDRIIISALHHELPHPAVDDIAYIYQNMTPDIGEYESWSMRGFEGMLVISDVLRGYSNSGIKGLDYDFNGSTPMRLRDDDTGSKMLALFEAINAYIEHAENDTMLNIDPTTGTDTLSDAKLAQLIVDEHERSAEICQMIAERQSDDPELIATILGTTAPLREGML
jgi:hypothetical protein